MKKNPFLCGTFFFFFFSVWVESQPSTRPSLPKPSQEKILLLKNGMVPIPAGYYIPFFSKRNTRKAVSSFWMDQRAVTHADFLKFVTLHPKWRKSRILRLFSDPSYLKHWKSDLDLGRFSKKMQNSPVVYVSWFPAKAYCKSLGKRLPTLAEWEYVGAASKKKAYGREEQEYNQRILAWYSKPTPKILPPVGSTFRNYFGVDDMHGLVWEWVMDFNTSLVTGDARGDATLNKQLFCGASSQGARDFKNYAAFMRYAFRSSLQFNYNTSNLGFRCVKEIRP